MSKSPIIRAWKNEEYRNSLTADQRAQIPEHPAGLIELTCEELMSVDGSSGTAQTTGVVCMLDDLKFTKDGGTFCGTKDITCERNSSGLTAITLR
jgi:mersacidin/lichenicidin family type 2 lantibiotic